MKWRLFMMGFTVLLLGCSSTELSVTLETFQIDSPVFEENGKNVAREAYRRAHLRRDSYRKTRVLEHLKLGEELLEQYYLHLYVFLSVAYEALPSLALPSVESVLQEVFQPVREELRREQEKLVRQTVVSRPLSPTLFSLWQQLKGRLRAKKLPHTPQAVQKILRQVSRTTLKLEKVLTKLKDLRQKLVSQVSSSSALVSEISSVILQLEEMRQKGSADVPGELLKNLLAQCAQQLDQIGHTLAWKGHTLSSLAVYDDFIHRHYHVFQDLSDPFWAFISQHPEGWQKVGNHVLVSGDGDTEFIVIFEDVLDFRIKYASVDPTKIIQFHLNLLGRVEEALSAFVGVAAKAYGVPIPSLDSSQKGLSRKEVDFSFLVAEKQRLEVRNHLLRRHVESLRTFGQSQLQRLTKENAEEVLEQLLRRLSSVLVEKK